MEAVAVMYHGSQTLACGARGPVALTREAAWCHRMLRDVTGCRGATGFEAGITVRRAPWQDGFVQTFRRSSSTERLAWS